MIALRNYLDAEGVPVCLICGRAIGLRDPAAQIEDCMIHAHCIEESRALPHPCEPQPASG